VMRMTALTLLYATVVAFVGAFLFRAVDWLEPNRRLALVLKYAIIAVSRPSQNLRGSDEYGSMGF
jgi:hypothetical protein